MRFGGKTKVFTVAVKIAIADDNASIRKVLRRFIESQTNWHVCGEADNGEAAILLVQQQKPDVLVLDLSMPGMKGFDAARKIALISPDTRIVLFTVHASDRVLKEAKGLGIRAVVSKDADFTLQRLLVALHEPNDTLRAA